MSREPYPFSDVVPQLRAIVDAFSAERLMWGSDIGRFYGRIGIGGFEIPNAIGNYPGKHSYEESLNFIRHNDQLSDAEKTAILGETLSRLLAWPDA